MDEQIENQGGFMETEKLLQQSQMPRTADGQEFRYALQSAKEDGL
jgi:hypothetical protein